MRVTASRYTPNVKATEVQFNKGEKVKYRMRNGKTFDIVIKSDYMYVNAEGRRWYGYEALFPDGEIAFATDEGIIDWEGKTNSRSSLDSMIGAYKRTLR